MTCALLLLAKSGSQGLERLLKVVLLLLHVLDGLVPLGEKALQAPDLGEQTAADLERELCCTVRTCFFATRDTQCSNAPTSFCL
jgi:hypothetical protein